MKLQLADTMKLPVDFRVREMLGHDVYDVPFRPDRDDQVLCSYCGGAGKELEDVQHQTWCVYVDGPVCAEVPN